MPDEIDSTAATGNETPTEPQERTSQGNQVMGTAVQVLPPEAAQAGAGLRQHGIAAMIGSLVFQSTQLRGVMDTYARSMDEQLIRSEARAEKLQENLIAAKVEDARKDERLKNKQMQTGAQVMLQTIGGSLLGFGLGVIYSQDMSHPLGIPLFVLGILMVGAGCSPLIYSYWR